MRTTLWIFMIVLSAQSAYGQSTRADTRAVVSGRVTDDVGCPLPGATVTISGEANQVASKTAVTDSAGVYNVSVAPGQPLKIQIKLLGFRSRELSVMPRLGVNIVDAGLPLAEIADDVPVRRVRGVIKDETGKPVEEAAVTLLTVFGHEVKGQSRTSADGSYTIEVRDHGHYVLMSSAPHHEAATTTVVFSGEVTDRRVDLSVRTTRMCKR